MVYATPWFEMLCGKRRVSECYVESDVVCGCSTVVPSTATPSAAGPEHAGPEHAGPKHGDPEHGHTEVFHMR